MDSAEIARVAAGLTKAQRRMVLTDDRGFAEHAKGKWHALHSNTSKRLFALGLIESPNTLAAPTANGLAVRAVLSGEDK